MTEEELTMLQDGFLSVVQDHARSQYGEDWVSPFARKVFGDQGDVVRKLRRIMFEGQKLTVNDMWTLAEAMNEPLSHIILDLEVRLKQKRQQHN